MGDAVTQAFAHADDVLKNAVGGNPVRLGDIIHIAGAGQQASPSRSRAVCWC